ncbi:hypothetical protein ACFQY7_15875 [Actinomadura luteofluorescens]|uniref:Uncharacterized protein n=1 Tax=Actinomadura luteofluorescens TaxID=46163 RepID=A0A7Y9ES20_9ACTN|nr:hypothetical protein [Actinomadura luteofluorescens]NYD52085.1 hypothetical protein [Actinomadura luteofluorescens]
MRGDGLLIVGLAVLAVYTGAYWERARRAAMDMGRSHRRVLTPRRTAAREREQVLVSASVAALALALVLVAGLG